MKSRVAHLAGLIVLVLSVWPAWAGDRGGSDALLPDGLTMEKDYRPGPGEPVGRVATVDGEAVLVHRDSLVGYRAEEGYALYPDDLIVTREKSRLGIELADGSRITLAAATRLTIDKSVYEPVDKRRVSLFGMSLGKARFLVKKIVGAKRSDFRVKTATAIAGVRGSDFVVTVEPEMTVVVALKDTLLEVVGISEPDRIIVLADYQRSRVALGMAPSPPEAVPSAEIERILEDLPVLSASAHFEGGTAVGILPQAGPGDGAAVRTAGSDSSSLSAPKGSAVSATVINRATGADLSNVATGKGAAANLGAVVIKGSKVAGTLVNASDAENVDNVATGSGSQANVGAVVVE